MRVALQCSNTTARGRRCPRFPRYFHNQAREPHVHRGGALHTVIRCLIVQSSCTSTFIGTLGLVLQLHYYPRFTRLESVAVIARVACWCSFLRVTSHVQASGAQTFTTCASYWAKLEGIPSCSPNAHDHQRIGVVVHERVKHLRGILGSESCLDG